MAEYKTNWAGNLTYNAANLHFPTTVSEVQDIVKSCNSLRVLGSRCTFNNIADNHANQVSLKNLNKIIKIDTTNKTVTVEGGILYGELAEYLHEKGYALHNLASLPHISVAGACSTSTHGSGVNNGGLATAVSAIEFVNGEGELVNLSREKDGDEFKGAVVGLGGIGIVTRLKIDIEPTFDVQQAVYLNLPMKELEHRFTEVVSSGYSVSLFTDYQNKNINQVWIKNRIENGKSPLIAPELYSAKLADRNKHPVDDQFAVNCTDQMGVPGPWHERLPHFKMKFKPSVGVELQSEHFVPLEYGYQAMMAIESLSEKIGPHLFIAEIRTVKGDDLWMSPFYKRTSVGFHFTWKQHIPEVESLILQVEEKLAAFNVRPHWGKLFMIPPHVLETKYERLADFRNLLHKHDPQGKFRSGFIDTTLYPKIRKTTSLKMSRL